MKRALALTLLIIISIMLLAGCGGRAYDPEASRSVITPLPATPHPTAPTGIPEPTETPEETAPPEETAAQDAGELTSGVGFVTTSDLNVRESPSTSAKVVGKLPLNKRVKVLERDGGHGWCKIDFDGKEAYIAERYVEIVGKDSVGKATVNVDDLNMRSQPLPDAEVLGKLAKGTKLDVYLKDAGEGWTLVAYDDRLVYVATKYVDIK